MMHAIVHQRIRRSTRYAVSLLYVAFQALACGANHSSEASDTPSGYGGSSTLGGSSDDLLNTSGVASGGSTKTTTGVSSNSAKAGGRSSRVDSRDSGGRSSGEHAGGTVNTLSLGGTRFGTRGSNGGASGGTRANEKIDSTWTLQGGTNGTSRSASGGTSSSGAGGRGAGGLAPGGLGSAGSEACDVSAPPKNVAAWIDESYAGEGKRNLSWHSTWLADAAMKGQGEIQLCVRYGATRAVSEALRDRVAPAMQRWFNAWFSKLYPYDCFPYASVRVKVTGWAVKPGQEGLLQWTDRSVPVYTEISDGADQAKGEPKCPDSCGFFFHPDHVFTECPGGPGNHFDYTVWLNDTLPSGAAAEGSDWGVRIPVASFVDNLDNDTFEVMLHEVGHGFAISDYYNWKGSTPSGGSVMMLGSSLGLSVGDQWMVRRYWRETKALRYR